MSSPQSSWWYSNGSAVATSISGARRKKASASRTGARPFAARSRVIPGAIAFSATPITIGRSTASRSRPSGPGHGLNPGPNGGVPTDRSGGVYGLNVTKGRPEASAATSAPQALMSTTSRSGPTSAIARSRSGASYSPRAVKAATAPARAARALPACQSVFSTASTRASMADASRPSDSIRAT